MLFYRLCEDFEQKDSIQKKIMIPEHLLKIFEEEEIELKNVTFTRGEYGTTFTSSS